MVGSCKKGFGLPIKGKDEIYLASKLADAMVIGLGLDQPMSACKDLYVHFCQKMLLILLD